MAVDAYRVTVAATATEITAADTNTRGESQGGYSGRYIIKNPASGVDVSLGGTGVTTSTGLILKALEQITLDIRPGDKIYGIVATGTQVVHVLRTDV